MPTPRISQLAAEATARKQQIDLSPAEQAAREAAGIPLDAPLTPEEIAAREAEKATLVQALTPRPAVAPAVTATPATDGVANGIAERVRK
jgi:hypothetical protein